MFVCHPQRMKTAAKVFLVSFSWSQSVVVGCANFPVFHTQNFTLSVKPRIFPAKDLQIRFFSNSKILSAHNYTVLYYRANPYCVKGHRQVQTRPDMPFRRIRMITSCTCLLAGIQPQESVTDLFFPWPESNFCYYRWCDVGLSACACKSLRNTRWGVAVRKEKKRPSAGADMPLLLWHAWDLAQSICSCPFYCLH